MSDEEINKIIYLNIDKVDIPNELYNAIIFMRDRFFQEKEKNEYLIAITQMYNSYEVNNKDKIIVADKEYFDMGLFARKFINKDKIKEKIKEVDKDINWNNADDHYYCINILKNLLGE